MVTVFWLPLTTGAVFTADHAGLERAGELSRAKPVAEVGQERTTLLPLRLIASAGLAPAVGVRRS